MVCLKKHFKRQQENSSMIFFITTNQACWNKFFFLDDRSESF